MVFNILFEDDNQYAQYWKINDDGSFREKSHWKWIWKLDMEKGNCGTNHTSFQFPENAAQPTIEEMARFIKTLGGD